MKGEEESKEAIEDWKGGEVREWGKRLARKQRGEKDGEGKEVH